MPEGEMTKWREGAERNRYRDTLAAAPEPPSGWRKDYPTLDEYVVWSPGSKRDDEDPCYYCEDANSYYSPQFKDGEFWCEFPPPPEDKP
jgi:hypothetical protein